MNDFRSKQRAIDAVELAHWIMLMADFYEIHGDEREPTKLESAVIALKARALAEAERGIGLLA